MTDILWLIIAAAMVLLMQLGFLFLETGLVRSKNSISVAMKNLLDFCVAALAFWAIGFGLMFGHDWSGYGLVGSSHLFFELAEEPSRIAFFTFQVVFCGTAATIVSGAVAERTRFMVYLGITCLVALVIYPIFGHWAWGGLVDEGSTGWLQNLGFIDFAGSTVVHSVGAWCALAAAIIIGPRLNAFDDVTKPIRPSNLTTSAAGAMLLWFGWWGFNGGSALALDGSVPKIILNTNLAAAAGGVFGCIYGDIRKYTDKVPMMINGIVAGLVAITASCHAVHPAIAILIGMVGAMIACEGIGLLRRMKIDDAVGAIPIHGMAGIWGTLAVALGDPAFFQEGVSHLEQLGIQIVGIFAAFLWTFPTVLGILWVLKKFTPLRVTEEAERIGLNTAEHGASTDMIDLFNDIRKHRETSSFEGHVRVEPHTEVGQIAAEYNRVIDTVSMEIKAREQATETAIHAKLEAEKATLAKDRFLANMSHEIRTPMNGVIGMIDVLQGSQPPLGEEQQHCAEVASNCAKDLMVILNDILDLTRIENNKMELESIPFELESVVEQTIQLHSENANRKSIDLYCWIYEEVPRYLIGDPTRLRQVFSNLVSNAIKFTEEGEVTLRISLASETSEEIALDVSVDDTGVGIKPEAQKRVFEAFGQEDNSTTRRFGGSGLGLTIARKIIESMGGRLSLQSEVGRGTSFNFNIRLRKTEAPKGKRQPSTSLPSATILSQNKKLTSVLEHTLHHSVKDLRALFSPHPSQAIHPPPIQAEPQILIVDNQIDHDLLLQSDWQSYLANPLIGIILLTKVVSEERPLWLPAGKSFTSLRRPILPSLLIRKLEGMKKQIEKPSRAVKPGSNNPESSLDSGLGSLRVLLVEDLLTNKIVAEKLMKIVGLRIAFWATNGEEALDVLNKQSIDLVFMDCQMPVMDGFEATQRIRKGEAGDQNRSVPIVAMTANALAGDRDRCLKAGMDEYISKPLQKKEIARVVELVAQGQFTAQESSL